MGVSFELPAMSPSGFAMLFLLVAFSSLLGMVASSGVIEVELTESELNGADRFLCCGFVQSKCARACAGRSCSLKCQGFCGPFNAKCGPYQCSSVANACSSSSSTSTSSSPSSAGSGSGTVILVGGNLKENNHAIWPRLVELAGEAGIGVLTAANSNAESSGNYLEVPEESGSLLLKMTSGSQPT